MPLHKSRTFRFQSATKSRVVALIAILLTIIAGYSILRVNANTSFVTAEVEKGQRSAEIAVISDTSASAGQAISFQADSSASIDDTFTTAWATGNHETLRSWFDTNVTGPPSGNSVGGRTISSQSQADELRGKRVTGDLWISGSLTLRDVYMYEGTLNISSGTVKLDNIMIDANQKPTTRCGSLNISGGNVDLYRVQIKGAPDGIRMTGTPNVTARYLFIHSVTTNVSCNGHHDGIQLMGGSGNFQRTFIDYSGGPSNGQGILVKADSQAIGTFKYNYSFFTGGGNAMTFEPKDGRFPHTIDLSNMLAARGCSINLFSLYRTSTSQNEMIQKYSVKISPSGKILQARNGITCSSL